MGELERLNTPEPKNEGEAQRARMATKTKLRELIDAIREAAYPADDPDEVAGG